MSLLELWTVRSSWKCRTFQVNLHVWKGNTPSWSVVSGGIHLFAEPITGKGLECNQQLINGYVRLHTSWAPSVYTVTTFCCHQFKVALSPGSHPAFHALLHTACNNEKLGVARGQGYTYLSTYYRLEAFSLKGMVLCCVLSLIQTIVKLTKAV